MGSIPSQIKTTKQGNNSSKDIGSFLSFNYNSGALFFIIMFFFLKKHQLIFKVEKVIFFRELLNIEGMLQVFI